MVDHNPSITIKPITVVPDIDDTTLTNQAVETFENYRGYLFSIAYRMLGSAMDAEDMVQETYLRYQAATVENIVSLKAYLTTILTRLCIDQLHLARRQRETYFGPWLPEPILTDRSGGSVSSEEQLEIYESISLAFLVLLEQLQPIERAVFLLREVFDYDYADIAGFLGRSEAACRQAFSRAKKHMGEQRPRYAPTPTSHQELLTRFLGVVQAGEIEPLMAMLAEDVELWVDGGGKIRGAASRPIFGRNAVAQFVLGANRSFLPKDYVIEQSEVNGNPALIARSDGHAYVVLTIDIGDGRIQAIRLIANPDKLAAL